jgi:hypothetical protein
MSDSCGFVDVGRSLWRENGSFVYNCCWPSPVQSFSGPSPVGLATVFYCLIFETFLFIAAYASQGYGGGVRTRLHTVCESFLLHGSLYSLSVIMETIFCLAVVTETCLSNRCLSVEFRICLLLREFEFGEPLASNALPLWLHYFGFQASCHNNIKISIFRNIIPCSLLSQPTFWRNKSPPSPMPSGRSLGRYSSLANYRPLSY